MNTAQHDAEILYQFTRQAEPFVQRHAHTDDALLSLIFEASGAGEGSAVLDVACGPGIVSCFFARKVHHVTGLDFVPAMLERAGRLQAEYHLNNLEWKLGQATDLPFSDDAFDCVVTRFSFHHFLEPLAAIQQMARVCRPGGTVLVADVTPSEDTQDNFNRWERLRDPSHTCALLQSELKDLGETAGLRPLRTAQFSLAFDLETLLSGSFPKPGDAERVRSLFEQDIADSTDRLGVAAHRDGGAIKLVYPITIAVWQK